MKKFLLISPKNRTTYNFRGALIKEIQKRGYEVVVTGPDEIDIENVLALGVSFQCVPGNKNGTSIVGDICYCKNLYKVIKKIKPDVVLGYTIKPVVYGAIASWLSGVKNINGLITGGGYTFIQKSLKARVLGVIVRTLYRFALAKCTHVIFQNEDDRREFIERRLTSERKTSVVNGSGVDMAHFYPVESRRDSDGDLCFLMISRLLKSKGVREYLQAAEMVKAKYPNARFLLLGKYEATMQDAIRKDYIEMLVQRGIVDRMEETNDVRPYYAMCDVYVLPSYREGTPRTVLEAMAMGKPIITTDTNGCRDTVIDGETGYLVPVQNAAAVAEKMLNFLRDPKLVCKMGNEARKLCERKYEVTKVNEDMICIMKL